MFSHSTKGISPCLSNIHIFTHIPDLYKRSRNLHFSSCKIISYLTNKHNNYPHICYTRRWHVRTSLLWIDWFFIYNSAHRLLFLTEYSSMGPNNYRRNATPFQWAMKMEQVIEENGLMMSEKIKELHDQLKVNHWSISYFLSISHQNKWHNWNALKKNHFLTNGGRGDNIGQIRDPKWIDTNGTNLVLLKIRFQYILATMIL